MSRTKHSEGQSPWQVLAVYAGGSFAVLDFIDLTTDRFGVPDWLFYAALGGAGVGLVAVVGKLGLKALAPPPDTQLASGEEVPKAPAPDPMDRVAWAEEVLGSRADRHTGPSGSLDDPEAVFALDVLRERAEVKWAEAVLGEDPTVTGEFYGRLAPEGDFPPEVRRALVIVRAQSGIPVGSHAPADVRSTLAFTPAALTNSIGYALAVVAFAGLVGILNLPIAGSVLILVAFAILFPNRVLRPLFKAR